MTSLRRWFSRHGHLVVFLLPGLLLYGLFMAYPLASSLTYSLYSWDGFLREGFVGLDNFRTVLSRWPYNERFWSALWHNGLFFLLTFAIQTTLGLFVAVLLNRKWRGFAVFQAAYFLPHTLSLVVVGFLWLLLLNPTWGPVAQGLRALNLEAWVHPWLGDRSTALVTIILVNAWAWLGFPILVYLAGLQGIPREYHEAALIDGANPWQDFRFVTLPMLMPTIAMVTILTFIWDFNAFELVFVMQGPSGSPNYATDLLATYFYRTAFGDPTTGGEAGQIGIAAAIGVLMLIIIGVTSFFGVRFSRRSQVEG
ncbi:MAG: sugar ABC transporter permease [Trueperaceae bacterium]|nr:sugar ABC transporter permease [Trueperaceae bacterium]